MTWNFRSKPNMLRAHERGANEITIALAVKKKKKKEKIVNARGKGGHTEILQVACAISPEAIPFKRSARGL